MSVAAEVRERAASGSKSRVGSADAQLFHRFTLQDVLGRGRMGLVWLARDDRLKRMVALKLVPEMVCLEVAALTALKRAAFRSVSLEHPNIVRTFDFMEDERTAAIAMEYIDGPTLSHLRLEKRAQCFAVSEIAPLMTSLCDALAYAHESVGVVHGDLKTSNLMINSRMELKVMDFGLAAALRDSESVRTSNLTLGYRSPQQLVGEAPAPTDDVYALGATLYELLSGKPPFYGNDVVCQVRELTAPWVEERRERLGIAGEAVPRHWEETIAACLAKNPAERPQTSVEVARRLGLGGTIRLVAAKEESKVRGLIRSLTHARVVGAAAGIAALIAAAVLTLHPVRFRSPGTMDLADATIPGGYAIESPQANARYLLVPEARPTPVPPVPAQLSSPAPEPEPRKGTLELAATPAGAGFALYSGVIGGAPAPEIPPLRTGTVPNSIDELPPGRYTVFFRNDGWPEERMELSLAEGETLPVNFAFPHGRVNITSTPAGAEIFLGSRSLGRAPLTIDLPVGKHELIGRYPKRSEKKQTVAVENGASLTVDFQMRAPSRSSSKRKAKQPESPLKKFGNSLKRAFSTEPPPKRK